MSKLDHLPSHYCISTETIYCWGLVQARHGVVVVWGVVDQCYVEEVARELVVVVLTNFVEVSKIVVELAIVVFGIGGMAIEGP